MDCNYTYQVYSLFVGTKLSMTPKNFFCLILPIASLMGCSQLPLGIAVPKQYNFPVQPISVLQQAATTGSKVYLRGQVIQQAPLLNNWAYQLEDKTGQIWVITGDNLPTVGTEVIVEGQVEYQSIPISEQDWGEQYIQELRKFTVPNR